MIRTSTLLLTIILIILWYYIIRLKKVSPAVHHYNMAANYDYNSRNRDLATHHYEQALINAPNAPSDATFIMERIATRIHQPVDDNHQFEIDLQRIYDMTANDMPVPLGSPRIAWHEDNQNVHDGLLNDTVAEQYRQLVRLGANQPATSINDIIITLHDKNAVAMLAHIRDHTAYITKINTTEDRVVQEVWKQVRTDAARQSFCEALVDSWNGGATHCVVGRISRVIQCLAHMTDNENLGILLTRESWRNEVFTSAGKILNDALEKAALTEVYAKPEPTDDETKLIDKVIEKVRRDTDAMIDTYAGKLALTAEDLQKIKEECSAAL